MYAIVDVETSGMGSGNSKITDIAIIIHDGEKIINEYQSLVNPQRKISRRITQLTGIDDEMVRHAPKFYEIAKEVFQLTEGHIFVAHNVSFDYRVIRAEFEELGGDFQRKQLCSVRASRSLLPGHKSYSLGNLCDDLGITITNRHRAYGDALATSQLFDLLLSTSKETGKSLFPEKSKVRQARIPPLLSREVYNKLPTATGVYYFLDVEGEIIYVGKANSIKQRVLSHFNDKAKKEMALCEKTANITFEITGSELVALLLESSEIKRLMPRYNHAQKRVSESFGLILYENRAGVLELNYNKIATVTNPVMAFYTKGQAQRFINYLADKFELCHRYTGIEKTKSGCFASRIKKCKGVCCGQEDPTLYNERVNAAIKSLEIAGKEYIISEPGRNEDENALIHVNKLGYQGFGFIPKEETINNFGDFLPFIKPRDNNSDSQRILRQFLHGENELTIIEKEAK